MTIHLPSPRSSAAAILTASVLAVASPASAGVMGDENGWLLATGTDDTFYAVEHNGDSIQAARTKGLSYGVEIDVTDLDGDGYDDVLLGRTSNHVSWIEYPGTGSALGITNVTAGGVSTNTVTSFRFDGGNHAAYYFTTGTQAEPSGRIGWILRNGSALNLSTFWSDPNAAGLRIRAGDLDGDGDDDLVGVGNGAANSYLHWRKPYWKDAGKTSRGLQVKQDVTFAGATTLGPGVNIGTLDGDSYADVLLSTTTGTGTLEWWEYNGANAIAQVASIGNVLNGNIIDIVFSDLDGDGNGEALLARKNGDVQVYERNGSTLGLLGTPVDLTGAGFGIDAMDLGDLDGDGLADDLVIASQTAGMTMAKWYTYSLSGNTPTMTFVQDIELGTNVRDLKIINAVVPEPAGLGLLGLAALALRRRR